MSPSVFRFTLEFSKRQQILALILTVISFPFLYGMLELPKMIINGAISADAGPFPVEFLGYSFGQTGWLVLLCFGFLALVLVNGIFKMKINTFKGVMAERLLRRLRYMLLHRVLRFPLPQFGQVSQGELVSMVTSETEPLGGFFGDAYVLPVFQGGTFLTILVFMFAQNWKLGLAATALVPLQGWLIPKLQKKINALGKERVLHVRKLSSDISEMASGIEELHAQAAAPWTMARLSERLGAIFKVRFEIYQRKFMMKFINNFINQVTPFFFYLIGGWLVIQGDLSFGALVAALAAYKDLTAPWKELLNYYQRMADAKIKYEQLVEQFAPMGMLPAALLAGRTGKSKDEDAQAKPATTLADGPLELSGVTLSDGQGQMLVEGVSLTVQPGQHVAILGSGSSGREQLGWLMGRLCLPENGKALMGGTDLSGVSEADVTQAIGYVGHSAYLFDGTLAQNLSLGLRVRAPVPADPDSFETRESIASGNSDAPSDGDWIDLESLGLQDEVELESRLLELLDVVGLSEDLVQLGLTQTMEGAKHPNLANRLLAARARVSELLVERGLADLVRGFDYEDYNPYASVAENILFGVPACDTLSEDRIADHPHMVEMLKRSGMQDSFVRLGLDAARTLSELFHDLPSGHPFYEQYSFVDEDTIQLLHDIARRASKGGYDNLNKDQQALVRSLPFRLTPQRHRLGLVDDEWQNQLVELRRTFHQELPADLEGRIHLYDRETFNDGLSMRNNILFGRIAHGRSGASETIEALLAEVIDELFLQQPILGLTLSMPVGSSGLRLTLAQRQRASLARTLVKKPRYLVINEGLGALSEAERGQVLQQITANCQNLTVIWINAHVPPGLSINAAYLMRDGRLTVGKGPEVEAAAASDQAAEKPPAPRNALEEEAARLGALPIFSSLDRSRLKLLAFTSERLAFGPGMDIIVQGETGDSAYVILDGEVDLLVTEDEAPYETRSVGQLQEGQLFGELALLAEMPRTATVRAIGVVETLVLKKDVFVELIYQDGRVANFILRDLSRRLAAANQQNGEE
ncbi:MAG: ABC transporter ATP-binding protein [Alphaproteobacteria bacterium]